MSNLLKPFMELFHKYKHLRFKDLWHLFLRELRESGKQSPERTARAAAMGVWMGASATFGLAILLVIVFSKLLKLNFPIAITTKLLASNPWTTPFIWVAHLWIGFWVLRSPLPQGWAELGPLLAIKSWLAQGPVFVIKTFFWAYVAGGMIFGTGLSLLVYGLVFMALKMRLQTEVSR